MRTINPVILHLEGDEKQAAMALVEDLKNKLEATYDKKTMRAIIEVKRPIKKEFQLFLILEFEQFWHVSFDMRDMMVIITFTPNITPTQKEKYLR